MNILRQCKWAAQYIGLRLIILIVRLVPLDTASNAFGHFAQFLGPFLSVHKLASENIYQHLTQDPKQIQVILQEMWNNLGHYVAEFILFPYLSEDELRSRIKINGIKNIQHLLDANQPILMMGGHFANWECAARLIALDFAPLAMIYRKANNPFVDSYINKMRNASNTLLIEKGNNGVRPLIRALKEKRNIAMLIDQKMNDGIPVPFLGTPAMTATAIAKLSKKHNYPIVPIRITRTNGSNFILDISPTLQFAKDATIQEIMLQTNKTLESWVVDKPGQWFWLHNRWGKARNS